MRKGKGKNSKLLPNSLRIISSCIKTVSTNASTAVRSAGASVAASISSSGDDRKEQVLWAGFDKLELSPTTLRHVLLLGYLKGFQVFDVEDASGLSELVSRREGPVTFLQMLPAPANFDGTGKYNSSHPMLVIVGGNEDERITPHTVPAHVIDFKSAVFMVRCSRRVVAIGLEEQVYCFDTLTLEKKFIVVTYPVPRVGEQGSFGINTGYGPMAVGPRWLAYPPNRPFLLNTSRVSPKSLNSSVSPSTYPGSGTIMARYAVESSKHLAAGLLTLGDMGYKKLSKYYPELLPESPSSPGWKAGKLAAYEPENAGVVAVKDLVSSEIISQFRAHTSPISALCFDPSGTLLVTASVHGNNINIFRIMPSHKGSGSGTGDWSTSYVHLYKLYRGMTSAVIQDICFSHYSQWIAIVSSRGTCHIFALSPFGGDDGFQTLHAQGRGTSLFLASTPPWWSTPTFTLNEQHSLPPPSCTLSVVTRIKCSDSGLLNSVSNAAASMVGKLWVPSGAVAAIFHKSNSTGPLDVKLSGSPLEHILVFAPSGFVVQHEVLSPMGLERSENKTESLSAPQANAQSEELRVKVEPIQWWDVCRRLDNMEREECISGSFFDGLNDTDVDDDSKMVLKENASAGERKPGKTDSLKSSERSHWYLSNAEVQINSCRLPLWQKSKMRFHVMEPPRAECYSGYFFFVLLLPYVYNLHLIRRLILFLLKQPVEGSIDCYAGFCILLLFGFDIKIVWYGSSRRMENLLDLDHMSIDRSPILVSHAASDLNTERDESGSFKVSLMDQRYRPIIPIPSVNSHVNFMVDHATISRSSSLGNEIPLLNVENTDSAVDVMPSRTEETVDFAHLFKEEYCNKPEVGTDEMDNSGNSHEEEKT
ncbi:UNVERIFIED_CONTAM: Autophagy-related protein 18g [Sesamum angustifolium]|uniref:Autophagy-related protein 18g n=1 Tax=Sesamum angustifolium TaxID=2727405 RepID=A0AAW2QUB6_9LAMI